LSAASTSLAHLVNDLLVNAEELHTELERSLHSA